MMREFRSILRMIGRNWVTLIYFEIIYKSVGFIIVFSLTEELMSLLPQAAGIGYLGQANVSQLLKEPLALLLGLGILMLVALYIAFEIITFMILSEAGWRNEKISMLRLWKQSAAKMINLLRPSRAGVLIMLPMLMFSVFSLMSGYLKAVRIPEFILDFILENWLLYIAYIVMICAFNLLLFLYLFGLPAMTVSGMTFRESWHESLRLLRGKKLLLAGKLIVMSVIFIAFFLMLSAAAVFILGIYTKAFPGIAGGRVAFQQYLMTYLRVIPLVGGPLVSVFLCVFITFYYHRCKGEGLGLPKPKRNGVKRILLKAGSVVILMLSLIFFSETEIGGSILSPLDESPIIIAHRAGASWGPENTLAALRKCIGSGVDAAEIDVQQLRDGTLVVMHDTNFKRTAGKNLNVWDADYRMTRGLNASAYLGHGALEKFEPIPTLEEFLRAAKGKIDLMIELKATGHENALEQETIQLIRKYDMQDQCTLASMNLDILRRVKQVDATVETVYISAILITGGYDSNFIDGYSVETSSLSSMMTIQAHFQGKKIYGWTANSNRSIDKLLRCGVDGVITDNPPLAKSSAEKYGRNLLVEDIVDLFYP